MDVDIQQNLCSVCQKVSVSALRDCNGFEHGPAPLHEEYGSIGGLIRIDGDGFEHGSASHLEESSSNCALCAVMWSGLKPCGTNRLGEKCVQLFLHSRGRDQPLQYLDVFVRPSNRSFLMNKWGDTIDEDVIVRRLTLQGPRTRCSKEFAYTPINPNPGSIESLQLIRDWMSSCQKLHGDFCSSHKTFPLPTRLIYVGSSPGSISPQLKLTKDLPSNGSLYEYVALSYCWGTKPFIRTTTSTLASFQISLPMDQLPQTIVDAIHVTRSLGISYLWVDALCIIQGEDGAAINDWQHESTRMREYYQGAKLTVLASSASGAHDGIFRQRNTRPNSAMIKIDPDCTSTIGNLARITPSIEIQRTREPLDRRAWALQEKLLSTRKVVFGSSQLSWTCQMTSGNEQEPFSFELPRQHVRSDRHPSPMEDKAKELYEKWTSIVEDYSDRNLTHLSDRLPALSGLAEYVKGTVGDSYVAGIWGSFMLKQLLWIHQSAVYDQNTFESHTRSPHVPTWSWASVNGAVKFYEARRGLTTAKIIHFASKQTGFGRSLSPLNAGIVVRGWAQKMTTIRCKSIGYYGGYDRFMPWMELPHSLKTYLDCISSIPPQKRCLSADSPHEVLGVWFLALTENSGLILSRCGQPTTLSFGRVPYIRIGMFHGYCSPEKYRWKEGDWFWEKRMFWIL